MGSLQNLSNSHIPYRILIETLKNVCRILYLSLYLYHDFYLQLQLQLDLYLELYLLDIHTYYIFNIHAPWKPITHSYTIGSLGIVLIQYLWNQQIQNCSACRVGVGHTAAAGASCGWRVPRSGCVLHSGLANAAGRHIGHSCPGGGGVEPPPNICSWCI